MRAVKKRSLLLATALVTAALVLLGEALGIGPLPSIDASSSGGLATTAIAIDGNGGDRLYQGVGAVLGGGGNARYLMDYPEPERTQILDYLFKPGYGAALQLLKLEIGGDSNTSDGAEPSVEPVRGQISCNAGYELSIAQQAVALNPDIRLYGLQWGAPAWVKDGRTNSVFTDNDIGYLLDWLGCARQYGLTISYLGGWNEADSGLHAAWFHRLREELDAHGYRSVEIVAADSSVHKRSNPWHYTDDPDVAILGAHDVCGFPTGIADGDTACTASAAALDSGKSLWASELGKMDAGAHTGCQKPCAGAMDRATVRGYIDARLTGYLEWPALDAMPPGMRFENRGLVTADAPWSGHYSVDAMTWAIAQFTQFAWTPSRANPGGWRYLDTASGYLQGDPDQGSYVSLVRSRGTAWSSIIETTSASAPQRAAFTISGVKGLAHDVVHVWASDFNAATADPARWFVHVANIRPVRGRFALTLRPGWVYSLTTTDGQGKGRAHGAASTSLRLPYADTLATSGRAGATDNEPQYLAAIDGAFELAPCAVPDAGAATCTEQEAAPVPVLWHSPSAAGRFPYAVIGDDAWQNYTVASDVLLTRKDTSGGILGRVSDLVGARVGGFNGYVFDVRSNGVWLLVKNDRVARGIVTLAWGRLSHPFGVDTWHRLALSMHGDHLSAAVDGRRVVSIAYRAWSYGMAGLEAGAFTGTWPRVQYSRLAVTQA